MTTIDDQEEPVDISITAPVLEQGPILGLGRVVELGCVRYLLPVGHIARNIATEGGRLQEERTE